MRAPVARRCSLPATRQEAAGDALVEAARERLVAAALALRPGERRSLGLVRFKVKTAELLLRLAEGA